MKLISATPSPWARKVRIVLIEKGIDCEVVNDVPWSPQTCVPRFNPLEKLPILVTDEGESVYESRLIAEWLERRFPEPPMIPRDDAGYLRAKICEVIADGVLDALLLYFFELGRTHQNDEWRERQLRKVVGGVAEVFRLIAEAPFAVGNRFSLADAAFVAMLGSLDFCIAQGHVLRFDWRAAHPSLVRYFEVHQARPSVIETRPVMFDYDPQAAMAASAADDARLIHQ